MAENKKTDGPEKEITRSEVVGMANHLTNKGVLHGKHLIKELKLFIFEPVIIITVFLLAFAAVVAEALGFFGETRMVSLLAVLFAGAVPGVIWFIKWWKYMPRGRKLIVDRMYKTCGVLSSSEEIPVDGKLKFINSEDSPIAFVDSAQEQFDVSTGRPRIAIVEGHTNNLSVYKLANNMLQLGSFANKLGDIIVNAKYQGQRTQMRQDEQMMSQLPGQSKYLMYLLVAVLLVNLFILALVIMPVVFPAG